MLANIRRAILSVRFSSAVAKTIQGEQIVPDIIDEAPDELVKVTYLGGLEVNLGNILKPAQVENVPTAVEWNIECNCLYTLCMTDPDAPSRKDPKYREWHHWLVGNIPGNDISKGETLSAYIGAGPLEGTGLHRYVFLVYKQITKIQFDGVPRLSNKSLKNRDGFNSRYFLTKYRLGDPIAINYYKSEYDCFVPLFYKKYGIYLLKK